MNQTHVELPNNMFHNNYNIKTIASHQHFLAEIIHMKRVVCSKFALHVNSSRADPSATANTLHGKLSRNYTNSRVRHAC